MAKEDDDDKLLGKKRPLPDNNTIPEKFPFTFAPPLLPGQKLFDQDQLDASFESQRNSNNKWSPAALSHRFRKRAMQGRLQNVMTATTTTTTTKNIRGGNNNNNSKSSLWTTLSSSPPNSISNYYRNGEGDHHVIYARHQAVSMAMINWLQFIFNTALTVLILYILFMVLWTLRHDFRIKTEEYTAAILDEIALCNRNYGINHCDPSTRVPAMEEKCNYWEACKNRDPLLITRSKVSAEMAAEILNSFVEPISYKTLFFFTILVIGSLVVSNTAFRLYRRKLLLER